MTEKRGIISILLIKVYVSALFLLFGVIFSGCDPATGMHRKISLIDMPPQSCIEQTVNNIENVGVETYSPKADQKGLLKSYLLSKGDALVELQVHNFPEPDIGLGFVWIGYSDQSREEKHIKLLNEIYETLIKECGLEKDQIKISDECIRMVCPE